MWDPARLYEDRTPETPKAAPRARGWMTQERTADVEGTCASCQQVIRVGNDITVASYGFDAPATTERMWHRDCWKRAYPETLAHYFHNFSE